VKCTHGATIGQIEDNALFYLRSRGIDEASARRLLLAAFAGECLERMKPGPAHNHVERLIQAHFLTIAQSVQPQPGAAGEQMLRNGEELG